MPDTSTSLLERLQSQPGSAAWEEWLAIYRPFLYAWLRRYQLQSQDADDIVQDVLSAVVRELPQFRSDPAKGAFPGWLRTVLANRLRAFCTKRQAQAVATGDSDFLGLLEQMEDPGSDLTRRWNEEHDRYVAGRLLERLRPEFQPAMWQAFCRVVLDGAPARAAAAELGVSASAVFIAKSRVLRRLRREMRGLTD
jgi:RNA polymerase sigma factor (sigma-70 family)